MYIGQNLQVAYPSYTNIDDISGSFNGVTTSFALTVNSSAPVPLPLRSNQCLISVGGVIQRPDDTGSEGFRLSGGNIIFSSAPNAGEDFFGVILAGADYVNVGANFPSGTAATPSITFDSDLDTGIYNSGANQLSFSTAGTERLRIDSAGNVGIGTTSPLTKIDSLVNTFADDSTKIAATFRNNQNSGVYSVWQNSNTGTTFGDGLHIGLSNTSNGIINLKESADLQIQTASTERARIDSSGRLLVGTSSASGSALLQVNSVINDSIGNVRDIPQNSQTAAYTLAASDIGKHISITTGGVTVPSGVFAIGDTISIYNNSTSNQTITQGGSVTLRQAGTANTGNRTLAQYGIATVLCVASNTFVISGAGLT